MRLVLGAAEESGEFHRYTGEPAPNRRAERINRARKDFGIMGLVEKGVSVMGRPCAVALVLLLLLAIGGLAFGSEVGNIHFGQLYVHPRIGVEATYDDNIFLLGPEEVDDVLFKVKPGVDFDFTREETSARLSYLAEIGRYVDITDYDYENHLVDAGVDLQFPSGLMIFVGDIFRITNDRLTYEWIPLVQRRQNSTDVKVGYEFNDRLSFRVAYDHQMLDYRHPDYDVYDSDSDLASGTAFYRIFQRISLLGQFQYSWIDYDQEGGVRYNSEGMSAYVGVTGQLTPKMVALVKGGWAQRDYDGPRQDYDGGVFAIDIVHHISETLMLTVGGTREAVESTYSTNNYFTTTEGRVGLEKQVGPKVSVGVSGFYANSDYPEASYDQGKWSERDDDIWGATVDLRYWIQPWLTTKLSYTHEERDSNQDSYDYGDNRVSVGVSAVF